MRSLTVLMLAASTASWADAQVAPLGEPDKYGAINYSVKCDNGSSKIVQCVRGDQRCGYAGEQTLAAVVAKACGASKPMEEQPAAFETAPASP